LDLGFLFLSCHSQRHSHLEAVPKVDVQNFGRESVQHDVARVPVAQPEDVARHAHHRERARVVGPAAEPVLGRARREPQHTAHLWVKVRVFGLRVNPKTRAHEPPTASKRNLRCMHIHTQTHTHTHRARRETGHRHKHTTRTTQHITR